MSNLIEFAVFLGMLWALGALWERRKERQLEKRLAEYDVPLGTAVMVLDRYDDDLWWPGRVVGPAHLMEWFTGVKLPPFSDGRLDVGYPVDVFPPTEEQARSFHSSRRPRHWPAAAPAERYLVDDRCMVPVESPDYRWPPIEPSSPVEFERIHLGAAIWPGFGGGTLPHYFGWFDPDDSTY